MTAHRVLVTGSRDWTDAETVYAALNNELTIASESGNYMYMVIIHGACPSGADLLASNWVKGVQNQPFPVFESAHPANWTVNGKAAGPMRNQMMVDLGADICLAFPTPESRGTIHCMRAAEKSGIPVIDLGVSNSNGGAPR